MRRLVAAISVLALVAALLTSVAVAAQESSPEALPMASPATIPEPLTAWAAAWAAGDVEGILAAYTDDATYEEVPIGVVTHGREELRAHLEGLKSAFPDISLVVTNAFVADDWAAAEWTVTMTYAGEFPGMPPGRGQRVSVTGATILELDGDKIHADREYWDAYAFLIALGALPAPEAAATPTA